MNLRLENRINASLEILAELTTSLEKLTNEYEKAKSDATPMTIKRKLRTIERVYAPKLDAARDRISDLTASIRTDTVSYGESVKNAGYHAVYAAGRTTWETQKLDGYAAAHPEILEFRKDSGPYVTIRKDQAKS